jgi:hypothetical protein
LLSLLLCCEYLSTSACDIGYFNAILQEKAPEKTEEHPIFATFLRKSRNISIKLQRSPDDLAAVTIASSSHCIHDLQTLKRRRIINEVGAT